MSIQETQVLKLYKSLVRFFEVFFKSWILLNYDWVFSPSLSIHSYFSPPVIVDSPTDDVIDDSPADDDSSSCDDEKFLSSQGTSS
jgi:hypothetical protein